ncbi:BA14K family protein [Agrobacterium sp.]|uniref:BA14K family protein n=1 Tax=Agrobacterium sp. TaxID=361 RepID=UPI0028AC6556
MMRFRTTSVATAIVMCFGSVIPVQAFQMPTVQTTQADNLPVVNVQDQRYKPRVLPRATWESQDRYSGGNAGRDRWERPDRVVRDRDRYDRPSRDRDRWDSRPSRDRYGWYNGHRGYSDRRPGYRYHNGYWFPMAAFAAGAIIGGAMQQGQPSYGNSHTSWCANRWRSYRAYDNTYQPYNGPRAQCVSPYGR